MVSAWLLPCPTPLHQEKHRWRPPLVGGCEVTEHRQAGSPGDGPAGIPADEPPEYVREQAKGAHAAPAGELAQLVFDSLVDAGSDPADHQLRFEHPKLSVWLEVGARPEGTEISGRVEPPADRVALHIRSAGLAMVTGAPEGCFAFGRAPHGLVRLSVEWDGPPGLIWTDWFRV